MSKLKVSIKKSTVTAMMKAGRKERINETELSQLARIKPCGIMHVTKTKKDSVIYTCPANINLTDRLKKAISKYDFFFMIEQIVIMVEDVYNNGLNVNSVRFNMDDVYINEMTKEMYFIYFPIVGGQESADIVGFIENIIYTMTPVINEDTNYISRFMYYVRSFHGFNGNAIEKYISREERAVVNVLKNKAVTMQQQIMQQQTMQQQIMQQVMQGSMDGTTVLSDDGISVQQIQQMQPVNYHFASLTNLWVKYIDDLSGLIDPNGGNLDIKKYKAILDADKEKLNAANMSVVKTLVSDGKVDEATDYVDVVDNLDLTYDEFMALSDEEKMAYLSGTSNWLTTLYPNVEMEEGIYEITVPLGVDMSATYNVTVSGSAETDSSETINVTIDQQQIVLANAQKFEIENLSAEMNSDGVSFSNEWDNKKIKAGIEKDGKIFLNSVIKNGESEMKYGASLDVSSISIQCEVTTQLEQNLAVTSSVKLEKSNNVDMKNWSAVRVEEEKENLDQVYWEMDPLYRESSMKKAEIFIADGISLTQILETLMQLAQYI